MDAGALELHLRRLPGVVACQLTATEVVVLLEAGDPAAVRIAAQASLDQAGSDRRIRVLATAPASPSVAPWRRRRFAVLAGAAGALSAGLAAASTLASMPGAVSPARDAAIAVPETGSSAGGSRRVRTLVPAPAPAPAAAADPAEAGAEAAAVMDATLASAPAPSAVLVDASPPAPAPAPVLATPPAPVTAAPAATPSPSPAPSAPAVTPEPGTVAAASDEDDDRRGRGRGRSGHPPHPHGQPPGHLQRAGHGPW